MRSRDALSQAGDFPGALHMQSACDAAGQTKLVQNANHARHVSGLEDGLGAGGLHERDGREAEGQHVEMQRALCVARSPTA